MCSPRPLLVSSMFLSLALLAGSHGFGQTVSDLGAADYKHLDTSKLSRVPEHSNDSIDLQTEAQVRRVLLADRSLTRAGRGVRVLSYRGEVTLRGSVRTPQERMQVARDAAEAVGGYRVHNRIAVSK